MRIAVFERGGRVTAQGADDIQVALVDVDPGSGTARQFAVLTPPAGAAPVLVDWLSEYGVRVVLTCGIDDPLLALFQQRNIRIVAGVPPFRVEPALAHFLGGTLGTGAKLCEGHGNPLNSRLPAGWNAARFPWDNEARRNDDEGDTASSPEASFQTATPTR
jgi:predicted Fe-Mo cluster-binding NifX family protein